MSVVGEFLADAVMGSMFTVAECTGRIFIRLVSFGRIRIQGSPVLPDKDEPEFRWYNVIWKTGEKAIWLSTAFAIYFGFFLWAAALTGAGAASARRAGRR